MPTAGSSLSRTPTVRAAFALPPRPPPARVLQQPPGAQPGPVFARRLGAGTFALQAHAPGSVVRYRNLRVKRLPD